MMNMTRRRPPVPPMAPQTQRTAPPPAAAQVTTSPAMTNPANLPQIQRRKKFLAEQLMASQQGDGPDTVVEGLADLGSTAIQGYFLNKVSDQEDAAKAQTNDAFKRALAATLQGGDATGLFTDGTYDNLDPGQQAIANALLERQFAGKDKPQRFEVGGNLVDENGNVVYQGAPQKKAPINVGGVLVDPDTFQEVADFSQVLRDNAAAGRAETYINMPGNPTPDEIGRGKFAEAAAKNNADTLNTTVQGGVVAQKSLGDIRLLSQLADATPTGAGQNYINSIAGYAKRLGIDVSDVANLDSSQQMTAIVNRIVPTLRPPGSGTMSDRDVQLFLESLPSLTNTPGGNKAIASNLEKIALRSVEEAKIADKALSGEITPSEARQQIINLGPLQLSIPQAPPAPTGGNNFPRGEAPKRIRFDAQGNPLP